MVPKPLHSPPWCQAPAAQQPRALQQPVPAQQAFGQPGQQARQAAATASSAQQPQWAQRLQRRSSLRCSSPAGLGPRVLSSCRPSSPPAVVTPTPFTAVARIRPSPPRATDGRPYHHFHLDPERRTRLASRAAHRRGRRRVGWSVLAATAQSPALALDGARRFHCRREAACHASTR